MEKSKKDAAKLVAGAVVGFDYVSVVVDGKSYIITPPTIAKLAGAAYWLSDLSDSSSLKEVIAGMAKLENLAQALSHLIGGDGSLAEELAGGTLTEVVDALELGLSLIDASDFMRLSVLTRSAKRLTARQR